MTKCINIKHPDFIELVKQSGIHPALLSAKMGVWMTENNIDEWPSLEQLGLSTIQYQKIGNKEDARFELKGNEGLYSKFGITFNNKRKIFGDSSATDLVTRYNKKYTDYYFEKEKHPSGNGFTIGIYDNSDYQKYDGKAKVNHRLVARMSEIFTTLYPNVNLKFTTNDIKDSKGNLARGSYDGSTVLIHSLLQNTDTLPHEYAHHYISMFINAPIVQQGIKLFGSEEELVQEVGEGTVKGLQWYNKFYNWIKGLFSDKQRVLNTLVNNFLKAEKLSDSTAVYGNTKVDYQLLSDSQLESFEKLGLRKKLMLDFRAQGKRMESLNEYEDIVQKAIRNIENKLAFITKSGKSATLKRQEYNTLLQELADTKSEQALISAIKEASSSIKNQYDKLIELLDESKTNPDAITAGKLYIFRETVLGYKFLEDVKALLSKKSALVSAKFIDESVVKQLDSLITMRNFILTTFEEQGRIVASKFLSKHSDLVKAQMREKLRKDFAKLPKVEKDKYTNEEEYFNTVLEGIEGDNIDTITQKIMYDELGTASSDVNWLIRWIENILDSPDTVVQAMARAFSEVAINSHRESHSYHVEMLNMIRDLEEQEGTRVFKDITDLYSFMLEVDAEGNLTGHYATKFNSALKKDFDKYTDDVYNSTKYANMSSKDQGKAITAWKDERTVLNKDLYYSDFLKYAEKLVQSGDLTKDEYERIQSYYRAKGYIYIKDLLDTLEISSHAADITHGWFGANEWNYREVKDNYKNKYGSKVWDKLKSIAGSKSNDINDWNDNDARIRFYKFIVKSSQEADSKLPQRQRLGSRIPSILKTPIEQIKSGKSMWGTVKDQLNRIYTILPDENVAKDFKVTDSQNVIKRFLPIRYTSNMSAEDKSMDLATSYFMYWSMANDYSNKHSILSDMELARYFVNNRTIAESKKNKPVLKVLSKLKDARVFKSGHGGNISDQLNDWLNLVMYEDKGEYTKWDKLLDKLTSYTSLRLLGLNLLAGISNVATGETLQKIEVAAGQHVTPKSWTMANAFYYKNMHNTVGDIGSRSKESIVTLLANEFDILNESTTPQYRKSTRAQQLFNKSSLFFIANAGEHWMQSRFLLAMLYDKKAYNKDGTELGSMLDMYQVKDGRLVIDERVDLNKSKWSDKDRNLFQFKIKHILRNLHGAYGNLEQAALTQYALGRMIMSMRKFIAPGFRRRWSPKYYNNQLGDYTEGVYNTWGKFAWNGFIRRILDELNIIKTETSSKDWYWKNLTKQEKANIMRTNYEILAFASTFVLLSSITSLIDNDDSEETFLFNAYTAKYLAQRLNSEMSFYVNPKETFRLLKSPAASFSMVDSTISLIEQLFEPMEQYERGSWKGEYKLKKKFLDLYPLLRQYWKVDGIKEQVNWMSIGRVGN